MGVPKLPDSTRAPRTHLTGSADPPSVPGWQDKIADAVWADEEPRRNHTPMQVNMGMPLRVLVRECAERRGMSSVAFMRRATAAFIAADLGMSLDAVCAFCPPVAPDRSHGRRGKEPGTHGPGMDDGVGYGHWHVCTGLVDGEPCGE